MQLTSIFTPIFPGAWRARRWRKQPSLRKRGSPRSIASLLQRVGRSGHAIDGMPKGRLFPLSRDELVECAALLDSVRRGELAALRWDALAIDVDHLHKNLLAFVHDIGHAINLAVFKLLG